MEVAGVVLGAVPLILYALENYQTAWSPIKEFRHWNETIETIRNEVFLQKQQLDTTLRTIIPELTDHTTMLEVESALKNNHPSQWERYMHIIRQMNTLVNDVAKDLFPDAQGPPTWSDARSERMNWEWRRVKRSFGRKERKDIFKHLQMWNTALQNCGLNRREAFPDTESRAINLVRQRFDQRQTTTIRENVRDLHKAVSASLACTCSEPHQGDIQLNWHENKTPTASAFSLAISCKKTDQSLNESTDVTWRSLCVNIEHSTPIPTSGSPEQGNELASRAIFDDPKGATVMSSSPQQPKRARVRLLGVRFAKDAYRRSKSPSGLNLSDTTCQEPSAPVQSRPSTPIPPVELCSLLQAPFDHQSFPHISIPGSDHCKQLRIVSSDCTSTPGLGSKKRKVRLHKFLSRGVDPATQRRLGLNRKQRFGIAAALTWAVLHLCDSPWLKGALNDQDINLFFEHDNEQAHPRLSNNPYMSCNLDFQPACLTPTVNEATPSTRFQLEQVQNLTLYTLAIYLIELGLNKPFEQLRRDYHDSISPSPSIPTQPDTSTLADDFDVAKHQITELILDAGTFYGHAVDRCLRFLFPGPAAMNTFGHHNFRSTFFADVVAPIQTTFELIPGSCSQVVP